MEHLMGCASRASGLIHLLAVAAVDSDETSLNEPTPEEVEGIMWLAKHTASELNAAMDAAFSAPLGTLENPPTVV